MGSGAAEPAPARYLRRLLVFGGLPTVFTMVKLTESRMPGGWTPPDLYPVLAFGVGLEGAITLGVTWYLLRWRRIPLVIRLVLVGIGVLFAACLFVAAFCYVIGQPLTSQ